MSGRFGFHTGVVGHGGYAADVRPEGARRPFTRPYNRECLPGIFRQAGMRTVSISPFAERHSSFDFYAVLQRFTTPVTWVTNPLKKSSLV